MGEARENVYTCQKCGKYSVTVDVDEGVTPFMTRCMASPGCKGDAVSSFYPKGPRPPHIPEPSHEWYRPETLKGLSAQSREHVLHGGLMLRRRTDRIPVMHGVPTEDRRRIVEQEVGRLSTLDARLK